ncbi:hypothetical protein HDV06_007070 [Boothiomyces sp. JEL0866]|nr:hypothetical protein HDV06_007070 [Boothiomyces sp. JEL0866]
MFRKPKPDEFSELVDLGKRTGIFNEGEVDELLGGTLVQIDQGNLPKEHQALVLVDLEIIRGWVYFGPTEEPRVWNLWWIGVDPEFQGKGYGKQLLLHVESIVKSNGAQKLIIETSSADSFESTRTFYQKCGYQVQSIVKDEYGSGEDKIVFKKDF